MTPAVFFSSAAVLAFEVLLARAFAVTQWNHLSFLVIGIALFGYAASGSWIAFSAKEPACRTDPSTPAVLLTLSLLASLCALRFVPLDYQRLLLEPVQAGYLFLNCLVFSLPFFFAGAITASAYLTRPERSGRIYAASLAGSATGVAAPAFLLPFFNPGTLIAASALLPLLPLLCRFLPPGIASSSCGRRVHARKTKAFAAIGLLFALAALSPGADILRRLPLSEFKFLSHARSFPGTEIRRVAQDLRGELDRVQSRHIRFAPGLSLNYREPLPAADALVIDGDRPVFLYPQGTDPAHFSTMSLSGLVYLLRDGPPRRVLVVVSSGGLALAAARAAGAADIQLFHANPHVASRLGGHYGVRFSSGQLRSALSRSPAPFDVIQVEHWGASLPGAEALDQEHLFTREAFLAFLERLAPEGVLAVSCRLRLPPADTLRLWATAADALARLGIESPPEHLWVFRSWDSVLFLLFRSPPPNREELLSRAQALRFDLVYARNAAPGLANRFHVFDRPYLFEEHRRLEEAWERGGTGRYFRESLLSVTPQGDLRPFPGSQVKWTRLAELHRALGGRAHVLGWAGEVLVALTLAGALTAAIALLLLPRLFSHRRRIIPSRAGVFVFLALGGGYIFAELFFLYVGNFWLGDPGTSLVFTLGGFLIASSIGGLVSGGIGAARMKHAAFFAALGFLLPAAAALLGLSSTAALEAPRRFLFHAGLVLVAGFTAGLPFAPAMRHFVTEPRVKAYAWAANGCASAVASIASAAIALEIGLHGIAAASLLCYAAAFGAFALSHRRAAPRKPPAGIDFRRLAP
ncbi:MAG: hypothetical protein WHT06_03670 [Desulfobacterales bacterium]